MNKWIIVILIGLSFIEGVFATTNDLKGALRTIDVNDTYNLDPESGIGSRRLISFENAIVTLGYIEDKGIYPWVKKDGERARAFEINAEYPFSSQLSNSFTELSKLDDYRVIFYNHADNSQWVADLRDLSVKRWQIIDDLFIEIANQTGDNLNFTDKPVYWAKQIENGKYIIALSRYTGDELWSYDASEKIAISLSPRNNSPLLLSNGRSVIYQVRNSESREYDIFKSDGTLENTTLIYSYPWPRTTSSADIHYNLQAANPSIEPELDSSYFFEYQDETSRARKLVEITSDGEVHILIESNEHFPSPNFGIVADEKEVYFGTYNKLFKYDYETKRTIAVSLSGVEGSIEGLAIIRKFQDKLFLVITGKQGNALPSRFYTLDLNTGALLNITNNTEDLYLGAGVLASNNNSAYIGANSYNGGNTGYFLKYSAESNKIEIINDNAGLVGKSFVQENQLHSFVTTKDSMQEYSGLHRYRVDASKWELLFLSGTELNTRDGFVENLKVIGDSVYFEAISSSISESGSISNEKQFWTIKDGKPRVIKKDVWIEEAFEVYNENLLFLDSKGVSTTLHSYEPSTQKLETIFEDIEKQKKISKIIGIVDQTLLLESYSEESLFLIDLSNNSLKEIDLPVDSSRIENFKCGNSFFAEIKLGQNGIWRLENDQMVKVLEVSNVDHSNVANKLFYRHYDQLKAMDCNTLITEVVYDYADFEYSTSIFDEQGNYYFRIGSTSAVYKVDRVSHEVVMLGDVGMFDLNKWKFTSQGIFAFDVESDVILGSKHNIYKFESGTFKLVNQIDGILNNIVTTSRNPQGWIVGQLYSTDSDLNTELGIYIAELNEFYVIDLFQRRIEANAKGFSFGAEKLYLTSYRLRKLGSELIEIKLDCLQARLSNSANCDTPLENQLPNLLNIADRNYSPGEYVYIPIRGIDADFDKLVYQVDGMPAWLELTEKGILYGDVPDVDQDYSLTAIVSDGVGESTTNTFKIGVTGTNSNPSNEEESVGSGGGGGCNLLFLIGSLILLVQRKNS